MKRADIQNEVKKGLRALNIIGIDKNTLKKAKAEISEGVPPEGIPSEDIPQKAKVRIVSNFIKVDADVFDKAFPTMDPYQQSVYRKLYRDSYGGNPSRNWCTIGYSRLQSACAMKKTGVINALERLQNSGWIREIDFDPSVGKTYRIYLPYENGIESKTRVEQVGVSLQGIPPGRIPSESIPSNNTPPILSEGIPPKRTVADRTASKQLPSEGVPLKGISPQDPLLEDHTLDLSLDPVMLFYIGIGQQKISKQKRERGNSILQELQKEGFSPEDIQLAIKWTLKPGNTKEKVHDFSIISHTIGQALAARDADEVAAENAQKEKGRVRAAEERQRRLEGEIEGLRSKLSKDKLAELRKRAEREIRDSGQYKEQFINEPLIVAKENEILRRKI